MTVTMVRKNPTKTCGKKVKYTNYWEAKKALRRIIMQKGLYPGEVLNTYYCPYCLNWHIGHKRQRILK